MNKQIYSIGGKEVITYIPKKANLYNLKRLYDVCNDLFSSYPDCFYSKSEVKKLKENKDNVFLAKR